MLSKILSELVNQEFKDTNYGRILILNKFEEIILNLNLNKNICIAVVGGSKKEPELLLLEKLGFNLEITTFGIEESDDIFFDLNEDNNPEITKYDLVICGQVLEHIWNVDNFVKNIYKIMNSKSYAFIHCPKSNMHHGHTYYSAGYSKEFMLKIFSNNTKILDFGELGTPRLYTSIHLLKEWITTREAVTGKINYRTWYSYLWNLNNSKPRISKFNKAIKYKFSFKRLLINKILKDLSNHQNDDKLIKSETFIFFKLKL